VSAYRPEQVAEVVKVEQVTGVMSLQVNVPSVLAVVEAAQAPLPMHSWARVTL